MNRRRAIECARAILDSPEPSHADAVHLALYVIGQDIEGAVSPSSPSTGGGFDPATPESAPGSNQSVTGSPACNLGGPSGFPKEADTLPNLSHAASVPTVYPSGTTSWQDEKIAVWLEAHAEGYEHGGFHDVAQTLRKKAMQVRRRDYLEQRT